MGCAHEFGKSIGFFVIILILAMMIIPTVVGIFMLSWLSFFVTLLVECLALVALFKAGDRLNIEERLFKSFSKK